MRKLVIIPGLGDREWLYFCAKPVWAIFGFRVHIFKFGWEREQSFSVAFKKLLDFIDNSPNATYIIGISAGGTAAVNALIKRSNRINKVITVCSPYEPLPHRPHVLLEQSTAEMQQNLRDLGKEKQRILSVHGKFDQLVPITASQPMGIRSVQINSKGHVRSIFLALTFMSKSLREFLRD